MSVKIKELSLQRAKAAKMMSDIVEQAEKEDRGLNSEERSKFDEGRKEIDGLDSRIKDLQDSEELREQIARPSNSLPFGDNVSATTKAEITEQTHFKAFMSLMRSIEPGLTGLIDEEKNILNEYRANVAKTDTAGGFLVPTTMAGMIAESMKAYGGIRNVATVLTTAAGEPITYPVNDDTGVVGELLAEGATAADGDMAFKQVILNGFKYSSKVVKVSVELMQDSAFPLDAFISKKFGERLGRITALHYAKGDGSKKPKGLMVAAPKKVTTASNNAFTYAEMLKLKHSIDPAYRVQPGCRWVFNDSTLLAIKSMVDSQNRPLWTPGLVQGEPDLIDGTAYIVDQGLDSAATGKLFMAFGDIGEYVIRDVVGIMMNRMVEKYIDSGFIGFLAFLRSDGNLVDTQAVGTMAMK